MDPPPVAPPLQPHHLNYPESLDSSPRSRNTDSWDDPIPSTNRLRLMCSYGGHIVPRPHDKSLCYVGGDTRIVVVDRQTSLSELSNRLSKTLLNGRPFTLKYQLPSEDLDSLISVTTDEDLDNMIDEYERTANHSGASSKPSRLRLFLFPLKPESSQSMGPILDISANKSEDWFLNALNGESDMLNRGFSDSASVNCLLGLDDDSISGGAANNLDSGSRDVEASVPANCKNAKQGGGGGGGNGQDVHSVPDSPMLENSSSFGSTSSSPSLANLPPIRVHVEDGGGGGGGDRIRVQDQKMGIEEQFARMTVGGGVGPVGQRQDDGGFAVLSSPPPIPTTIVASAAPLSTATDYLNRVVSDDERSDHGAPVGYRKPTPPQPQLQPQTLPPQSQLPKSSGVVDLPSPDSVSSDNSLSNAMSRPKPVIYQDPVVQIPSANARFPANLVDPKLNLSDPNTRIQMQQQVHDSGYVLQSQFDHQQQQQQHQQHPQQAQQPHQFIHPGTHYIQQHPGSVPIPAYYPVYPPQQQQHHHHHPQLDQQQQQQQYQFYYMPTRQPQPYTTLPVQQSNISDSAAPIPSTRSQTPPNPAMSSPSAPYNQIRNPQIAKPELGAPTGVYRTATTAAPPLVQVPSAQHQQQFVGYPTQMHHPSQSAVPSSGGNASYAYEYATDPSHAQIYYTQPLAPSMPSQYQTMTSAAAMGLPEVSAQLPTDSIKQQR
ncbi:RNA polymerase II degradation factor 1-like [Pyrus ussuriensis x Pyrus communis]|uniref:RNA polymerase II degradation factor 1-like n=1 Tax=Pyrus ussuriensis x Pyrus communis TaxID=2448454 RepID=A0A5N5HCC1_9ROSA|nr:RNA polymerase II degradation factor 1 [Pyrus x bretschneideri]KAB2624233.1 RNA polymerase II degradation factor 1-like [Pyrus ussuriensis x Pyrus communis]